MDADFGVGIALHADRFARPLARPRVGLGALATHGQPAQVARSAVAFNALEALQIHADIAAQIAFDQILAFLNGMYDRRNLLLGELLCARLRINLGARQDFLRVGGTNAIDVAQRDINPLLARNLNTDNTCHNC